MYFCVAMLKIVGLYGQLGLDSLYFGKWRKKIAKAHNEHDLDHIMVNVKLV